MVIKIGINGFGRIGRVIFRTCQENANFQVSAINDPAIDVEYICYLIKFDSTHGKFKGNVTCLCNDVISINGSSINIYRQKQPTLIPWDSANVEYVIEATGMFTTFEKASGHLQSKGVKKVIVTAPSVDIPMILVGVNDQDLKTDAKVISCASSTLYCLAPIIKILDDSFGVAEGFVTSIHAMTPSLKPLDGVCSRGKQHKWRDHRSIHQNIIPAPTSICKALEKILPHVKGKLVGLAFRVPIVNVSVLDITIRLDVNTCMDEIVDRVENASKFNMRNIIKTSREKVVSSDFIGDRHSCTLDIDSSLQLRQNFFKLICWYENEYSYASRVIDVISYMDRMANELETKSKLNSPLKHDEILHDDLNQEFLDCNDVDLKVAKNTSGLKDFKKLISSTDPDLVLQLDEDGLHTKKAKLSLNSFSDGDNSNIPKSIQENKKLYFGNSKTHSPSSSRQRRKRKEKFENAKPDKIVNDKLLNKPNDNNNTTKSERHNEFTEFYNNNRNRMDRKASIGVFRKEADLNLTLRIKDNKSNSITDTDVTSVNSFDTNNSLTLEGHLKICKTDCSCTKCSNQVKNEYFKKGILETVNKFIDGLSQTMCDHIFNRKACVNGIKPQNDINVGSKNDVSKIKQLHNNNVCQKNQSNAGCDISMTLDKEIKNKESKHLEVKSNKIYSTNLIYTKELKFNNNKNNIEVDKKHKIKSPRKQKIYLSETNQNASFNSINRKSNVKLPIHEEHISKDILNETDSILISNSDISINKYATCNSTNYNRGTVSIDNKINIKKSVESLVTNQNYVNNAETSLQSETNNKNILISTNDMVCKFDFRRIKQDIYDKLDSATDSDSENSFQINERKSQVLTMSDLTNSFEDIERLNKICRIIEISDELSDKLFSPIKEDSQPCKGKTWSFRDLCQKIKLDDFYMSIFNNVNL